MRRVLLATITAVALVASSTAAADYDRCGSRIANSFWTDLRVDGVRCLRGAEVARAWVRRHGAGVTTGRRPRNPQRVDGWRCRLEVLAGESNPYGRVTCAKGQARVRFYGFS